MSTIFSTFLILLLCCYADDTCLYVKASKEINLKMNREDEMANHKLIINTVKSSALIITSGAKTVIQKTKILCDGRLIAVKSTVETLGTMESMD